MADTDRATAGPPNGHVMIFAPLPILTVTVEDRGDGVDIHLHAGGQGVWQARMVAALDTSVTMCTLFGGETGQVLRHLIPEEGIELRAVLGVARNGAYIHDRRSGRRVAVAEDPGDPIQRHELDELYNEALVEGLSATVCVLSGPHDPAMLPADVYRRLAHDLSGPDRYVVADLAGDNLTAAIEGGANVIKVSHEELMRYGHAGSDSLDDLLAVLEQLRDTQAKVAVVSRAGESAVAMIDGAFYLIEMPSLEPVDPRGAGDSMTAGIAAALASGQAPDVAVRLGAAAGAVNVTRSGLGTGDGSAVIRLLPHIRLTPLQSGADGSGRPVPRQTVTPDDLAAEVKQQ
ncbi:MAG: 1-phosphofructokinase family hexose kinase [Actinomycetes bacterium]